ncbi:transcription factor IBH1-like 1 [Brachypodium distachyon]|uniref:IBH1-like N-terminal domain-containing protein n=1 Tax=Brachypodium distachyon TaxID=15368 RepID=A0A0Q3M9T8_BRADI|nr:transcription factor IBH1-like 1 [Brachypodium distachyon]KQK01094.1 hypothetical protein BRADI_3g53820v3 [Brachypodium distachyon]|eukprot:XP_003572889.2 transcription factor IBH1-like 1 [Brachypodium distachyon]
MQGSMEFKQALLEKLLLGLRERGVASGEMGFHERKSGIKRAADTALASARGAAPRWSRALQRAAAAASTTTTADRLAQTTTRGAGRRCSTTSSLALSSKKMTIFKRRRPRKAGGAAKACSLARAMARKRAGVLRGIVPGGKGMDDERTLLRETLDYAVCLRAQVDVMQLLVRALQAHKP